ncbi:PucR family transcriptional regulator [Clostridium sp. AF19-22AC]|jgi:hypothetical protein|uniref:PucR family transcriptional regulator n=1 Tax=Clostridia TaxID=186801 RepID=UPI000E532726|nr:MULTISPECIES: PucR family transcriptional regulator [Clostridia]RHR32519.1 PucR family transcriptional regulator [Clostridium sp. AF19-22AC]
MAVTLRQLYEDVKTKEDITLVAGEQGLDHTVRWVHMVEGTEISSFLEGDEVAFTTGIALKDMEGLLELAVLNQKRQAAGMVVNLGPYIKEIPAEVLAFGNENGFPIFSAPWRVHMANIMREFTRQILLDDMRGLEVEAALKNAFFLPDHTELYLPVLKKHGYKPEWLYCVTVIEIWDREGLRPKPELLKKLVHFSSDFFRVRQRYTAVIENEGDIIVLFCNMTEEQAEGRMSDFTKKLHGRPFSDFGLSCYMGSGSTVGGAYRLGESFEQAERVKSLQKKRGQKNTPLSYSRMGAYKLFLSLKEEVREEYYTETLGCLEKYDHINETDYLYFLKKFFELGCSTQEAAARLHLHRNSVAYKLRKIEEIIQMPVNEPYSRTKIMIALMLQEIQ